MPDNTQKTLWPGWETVRRIGRGSFGTVYEINKDVYGYVEKAALKVLTIPLSEDEVDYLRCTGLSDANITQTFHKQVADIAREYKLMAQMRDNPNVVHCDGFRDEQHSDDLGWDIYIKMELLTPLIKALDKVSTPSQILQLGIDICNALVECQENNIIHRDIKPQNIFISEKAQFKLGDFGIARTVERTTRATAGVGTYSYMAPEVMKNEAYGKTADIYSLGLVLHWLLNEHRGPFMPLPPVIPNYTDEVDARNRRFRGDPIPAPKNGNAEFKAIVLKACAYDPKDRYQSAAEMMAALKSIQTDGTALPAIDIKCDSVPADILPTNETLENAGHRASDALQVVAEDITFRDELTIGPGWKDSPVSDMEENPSKERIPDKNKFAPIKRLITHATQLFSRKHKEQFKTARGYVWISLLVAIIIGFVTIHFWSPATCTSPEICKICGRSRNDALGHSWSPATCTAAATCSACGLTEGEALGHSWTPATCTAATTCSICGIVEGAALGHSWVPATCTAAATCSVCSATDGDPIGHSWTPATCTAPATCSVCGATDGDPVGHGWVPATCTAPATCSVCGATDGDPAGHSWVPATCAAPATCSTCGATEGNPVEHSWVTAEDGSTTVCSVCGVTQ